jgi:hypothetical protein
MDNPYNPGRPSGGQCPNVTGFGGGIASLEPNFQFFARLRNEGDSRNIIIIDHPTL